MSNIGFIIHRDSYKSAFDKGFFKKGIDKLTQAFSGGPQPWIASNLYDESLNQIGVVIASDRQGLREHEAVSAAWNKILTLLEQSKASCIITEGMPLPEEGLSLPVFDGTIAAACYLYMKKISSGDLSRTSSIALLIGEDTDCEWLEYFCDEYNYIKYYSHDRQMAQKAIDYSYAYNGTAAEASSSLSALSGSDAIFCLSPELSEISKRIRANTIINPYSEAVLSSEELKVSVYTDKLGVIQIGPACFEALYYIRTGQHPLKSLYGFQAQAAHYYLGIALE
ncbi:MAG: hypothetical protein FWG30_07960 [Eubacteriaceae bacterium]|nr:hypothetical protein [Eubacteriaceae bacterium]